jgi:hypothetical protein
MADIVTKIEPIKLALKEALKALERAERDDYLPHFFACLEAAKRHLATATTLSERIQ